MEGHDNIFRDERKTMVPRPVCVDDDPRSARVVMDLRKSRKGRLVLCSCTTDCDTKSQKVHLAVLRPTVGYGGVRRGQVCKAKFLISRKIAASSGSNELKRCALSLTSLRGLMSAEKRVEVGGLREASDSATYPSLCRFQKRTVRDLHHHFHNWHKTCVFASHYWHSHSPNTSNTLSTCSSCSP